MNAKSLVKVMQNESNDVYTMEDFFKEYALAVDAIDTLGCRIFEHPEIEQYMKEKHMTMDYAPFWIAFEYIEKTEEGLLRYTGMPQQFA